MTANESSDSHSFAKSSPDSPEQAEQRARYEAELLEKYGAEWVEEHRQRLDRQWEYMKGSRLV
jgi:hypothetical protein